VTTRLKPAAARRPFLFFGPAPGRRSFLRLVTGGALSAIAVGTRGLIDAPVASASPSSCCGTVHNIWCPSFCTAASETTVDDQGRTMLDQDFDWGTQPPRMICWTCNGGQCRCCECSYWAGWPPNCWWVYNFECGYEEGCCSRA